MHNLNSNKHHLLTHSRVSEYSRAQRGFNLIEVLIALVVLAVGLLGLAALQNFGLRTGHQSYERTQATILADEIIDRMRANLQGTLAGNYQLPLTATPPGASNCMTSSCSAAALAQYDMNQWICTITGAAACTTQNPVRPLLAGGKGAIVQNGATGPGGSALYTVTVQWEEQGLPMSQNIQVQLP